jgi:hypothetical protein
LHKFYTNRSFISPSLYLFISCLTNLMLLIGYE